MLGIKKAKDALADARQTVSGIAVLAVLALVISLVALAVAATSHVGG